ncbi:MAG: HAD-IIA family hydrolase [Steroidobacteraceae bacterium]
MTDPGDLGYAGYPAIEGFMFDVDGTLLLSDRSLGSCEVLPGAIEVLTALKERSVPFALLTNGSAYPPQEQAARLRAVGLPVEDSQMITPSSVTVEQMSRLGTKRVLVLGTRGVGQPLLESGIQTVYTGDPDASQVEAVYVGWHPNCGMPDIEAACNAIWNGAKLYAASDVPFFASKQGRTIGYTFAIIGAIRRLTRAPVVITGKPSLRALRFVSTRLGVPVRKMGVVGDDPLVEAVMARRGGATMFGVTTGMTTREEWLLQPTMRRPHRVLGDLRDLLSDAARMS